MNLIATVFVFAVVIYFQVSNRVAEVSEMWAIPFEMLMSNKSMSRDLVKQIILFFRL
jgi:hypothetical protein